MQGWIPKAHYPRFSERLLECHAYYIHYFEVEVKKARDAYRVVDHSFEVWLTKWTRIIEIMSIPESLSGWAYKLTSFQNIPAIVNDKPYLAGDSCRCGKYFYVCFWLFYDFKFASLS